MPVSDQGSLQDRYLLIPRTLIFLVRDEQVLLLKGAAHKSLWAGRYNGVGGHVERGESLLAAANRELFEETGLQGAGLRLCGTLLVDTAAPVGVGVFVFRGECGGAGCWEPVASREGTLEWVGFERLGELPLVEDLPVLLPRVLSMRPGEAPFSALSSYDAEGRLVVRFADQGLVPGG